MLEKWDMCFLCKLESSFCVYELRLILIELKLNICNCFFNLRNLLFSGNCVCSICKFEIQFDILKKADMIVPALKFTDFLHIIV